MPTIPASVFVQVTPSVLPAGGGEIDLNGIFLTQTINKLVGGGAVSFFPNAAAVGAFFGLTSPEFIAAGQYFAGYDNSLVKPGSLGFSYYNTTASTAFLRGGALGSLTLAQLQALGSGTLTITQDGNLKTGTVNLAAVTSFANAAATIAETLELDGTVAANATGSQGATWTGTGVSSNLTVSAIVGSLHPGDTITGTGIGVGVTIVSQTSGTTGGNGVYVTSAVTTITSQAGVSTSTFLEISAVSSGAIPPFAVYAGTGVTDDSYITAFGTGGGTPGGTGQTGNYISNTKQQFASTAVTVTLPGVIYDSVIGCFTAVSALAGPTSSMTFATGTLSSALNLTQATGAVLSSPGLAAATPSGFMTALANGTQNWATFATLFDPDGGVGNAQKQLFATWVSTTNNRYCYVAWDTDTSPASTVPATTSLGQLIKTAGQSGTCLIYAGGQASTGVSLASFICGAIASIDFEAVNGRVDMAFRSQAGQTASVTDPTTAANVVANAYNYYGAVGTANVGFIFFYPGSVSGTFLWLDSYVNQIWMNSFFQSSLMTTLTATPSIPFNPAGAAILQAGMANPIQQAANFGAFRPGVTLSAGQIANVNASAGQNIAPTLQTRGWYLQVPPASPSVRQARGPQQMTFWYVDGQSVQSINLSSIELQ